MFKLVEGDYSVYVDSIGKMYIKTINEKMFKLVEDDYPVYVDSIGKMYIKSINIYTIEEMVELVECDYPVYVDSIEKVYIKPINITSNEEMVELVEGDYPVYVDFIEKIDFPDWIKNLKIASYHHPLNNLPSSLEKLSIEKFYNHPLDKLPKNLKNLTLEHNTYFDKPLDNLPINLKELEIYCSYTQPINNLPQNLKNLTLSFDYIKPLDNLPLSIENLKIVSCNFNQSLDNLPQSLETLTIECWTYNCPINNLPNNLKKLSLYIKEYNQPITNLPKNLKKIIISKFNKRKEKMVLEIRKILGDSVKIFYGVAENERDDQEWIQGDPNFDYKKVYYKFTNPDENHNSFQYRDGLNINTEPFNPSLKSCSGGGLYFTEYECLDQFTEFMIPGGYLREVTIPENEPVIKEDSENYYSLIDNVKYKSNKIILGKKIPLNSDEALNFLISINNENIIEIYKYKLAKIDHEILNKIQNINLLDVNIYCIKLKNYMKDETTENKFIKLQQLIDYGLEINKSLKIKLDNIIYACVYTHNAYFIEYLYDYAKSYKSENKEFTLLTENQTINNINNEINKMYGTGFMEIIQRYGGIIAGSYIISHLTNKSFENNTIDIYVKENSWGKISSELNNYLGKISRAKKSNIDNCYIISKYNFKNNSQKNIRIFEISKEYDNPISFIQKTFDYSFCQVWYDGEKIESIHPIKLIEKKNGFINKFYIDEYNKIKIVDYSNIQKDTAQYCDIITKERNIVYRIAYIISQYFKYTKRGFNIINIDDVFEICKNLHLKINKIEIDTNYYIL